MTSTKFYYYTESGINSVTGKFAGVGSKKIETDESDLIEVGSIYRILRPLLLPASYFGLFPATFQRHPNNGAIRYTGSHFFFRLTGLLFLSLHLFNLYDSISLISLTYKNINADYKQSFDMATFIIRPFLDITSAIIYIIFANLKARQFALYFGRWLRVDHLIQDRQLELKNYCRKLIASFWLSNLMYAILLVIYTLAYSPLNNFLQHTQSPLPTTWGVIKTLAYTTNNFASSFFLCVLMMLAKSISAAFVHLSQDLQQLLRQRHIDITNQLEAIRQRHMYLSGLLSEASHIFSPFLLLHLGLSTLNLCSIGYSFLVIMEDPGAIYKKPYELAGVTLAIAIRITSLWFTCCSWEEANENYTELADVIYRCSTRHLASKERYQLLMLESKISEIPAKISAGGLIDLENSLFIKIVGVIATYVVVMVQARNTG